MCLHIHFNYSSTVSPKFLSKLQLHSHHNPKSSSGPSLFSHTLASGLSLILHSSLSLWFSSYVSLDTTEQLTLSIVFLLSSVFVFMLLPSRRPWPTLATWLVFIHLKPAGSTSISSSWQCFLILIPRLSSRLLVCVDEHR